MEASLGIDIAKAKFAVALLTADGNVRHKSCANTPTGFADLAAWYSSIQFSVTLPQ